MKGNKSDKEKEWESDKDIELQSDLDALNMYVDIFARKVCECNIKDNFIDIVEKIGILNAKPKIRHLQKELSKSAIRFNGITWDYNAAKKKFVEKCDCKLKR